jgi:hypothetical protein
MEMSKKTAQKKILVAWFVGTTLIVLILIAQMSGNKYGDDSAAVWDWILPFLFPTLTMAAGGYIFEARQSNSQETMIDRFNYQLCLGSIMLYFIIWVAIFGLSSYAIGKNVNELTPFAHLKNFSKLLTAVHGIVTLLLGILFVQQKKKESP